MIMAPEQEEMLLYWPGESVPHTGEYLIIDTDSSKIVLRAGEKFPEGKAGSCYFALQGGCPEKKCDADTLVDS
jgi:hypothetical protein